MSQWPDPNNPNSFNQGAPLGYQSYSTPPGVTRPTSVTVMAILGIILGGLGTLCMGFGSLMGAIQLLGGSMFAGARGAVQIPPQLQAFSLMASVIELVLSVVLLAAGIGALSLKPWARRVIVPGWSLGLIVWALVRLITQIAWVTPATVEVMKQIQKQQPAGPSAGQMQSIIGTGMILGALFVFGLEIALPICFLILWRKPHVIAAFEGASVSPG